MKKFPALFALIASMIIALCAQAQTADEIVSKYINAIGGADNWKKINSYFFEGNLKVHGTDVIIYKTVLQGKGMRQNMVTPSMTAFQIYTPTEGWHYLPFEGQQKPELVSDDQNKNNADQFDAQGVLLNYVAKGHQVEFKGKDTADGKEHFKLLVRYKSGKEEVFYFDANSYLLSQVSSKKKVNGVETNMATKYRDYKKLDSGILFPMTHLLPMGTMTITRIDVNKPVDENIFKPID